MDISELEQVINLLRKNGLSEAESALVEDVMETSHLASSDFEMFLFPMVPPPPHLKIPATKRPPEVMDGGCGSETSSEDEFVSLESSTTELCSSEFTNPYGIRTTTRPSSRASSDRMSQFGTARDYPDFDMQDDQYWYKEKDEDYLMPPLFRGPESSDDPGEDKFIMTVETGKHRAYQMNSNHVAGGSHSKGESDYLDFQWPISLVDDVKEDSFRKGFLMDRAFQHEGFLEKGCEGYMDDDCFTVEGVFHGDYADSLRDLKLTEDNDKVNSSKEESQTRYDTQLLTTSSCTSYCTNGFNSISDLNDCLPNGNGSYSVEDYMRSAGNALEPDSAFERDQLDYTRSAWNTLEPDAACEKGDANSDELVNYDTTENDYEIFHLRVVHRKNRTGFEENKDLPIIINQVIAGRYQVMEYLGSAAFSKVVQALDLHTGMDVCLKIIKNDKDFFDQSLDEIKLLKFVNKNDPGNKFHILRLYDYFYHQEHLFIVTELLRANLYEFQKFNRESGTEPYFTLSRMQVITRQCLEALDFLHGLGIIHCDLKPENILIKSYQRCEIKVIDLGSSCFQADNLSLYVQSRSYRAPEVILGVPYDQKIDLWSLGCVLSELCSGEVLFPNEAIVMLLARVIGMFGLIDMEILLKGQETHKYFTREYDLYHINEETNELEFIIPEESSLEDHLHVSDPKFIHFIKYLFQVNPKRRPTAREALRHPWLCHSY